MPSDATERAAPTRRPILALARHQTEDTARTLPHALDDEQAEAQARRLLELAGSYNRQALAFPAEVEHLRTIVAEQLLENAMLRLELRQLGERVEALERRQ